jgi:glycine/D-amino acid oxidase-like deaminating enzyme
MANYSPWIHQLNKNRVNIPLMSDATTDVAIVGAGIAGVSTAYFLLKHTNKNVMIIEGDRLAHGATGHNAGQIVAYFERPFREIVAEFGLDMACEGQRSFDEAWQLLSQMYTEAGLDIPLFRFQGYTGHSTKEQVLGRLENDFQRRRGGLHTELIGIYEEADFLAEIPEKYKDLFSLISREEISLKLETFDPQYIAVTSSQKGVMNSALFCQEVVAYMLSTYGNRFKLYERTHISKVVLKDDKVLLDAEKYTIECEEVVLCTNGFENFEIIASTGLSIDTRFHHHLDGIVAFMAGYLEPHTGVPAAISYFQKEDPGLTDDPNAQPYFYVTRRPYEYEKENKHNLISVGGPDFTLEKKSGYSHELEFSDKAREQIGNFIKKTYDKKPDYNFMWHGVMGYTKNLLRMIGPDPEHKRLHYNLGCNGVGILLSVFGGDKVARQIKGEEFPKSIFDIPTRKDNKIKPLLLEDGPVPLQSLG